MSELFNAPAIPLDWTPSAKRINPLIELKELVLVDTFAPGESVVLRRIKFRTGLNIIWADPKVAQAAAGGDRTSGHSAGKTTLCRIIRWLLGESHFGNEDLENRIATTFTKGLAILSLNLDGKPWVVGRRFFDKSDHQAVQDADVDDILENGWPEKASVVPFLKQLTRLTIAPLPEQRFPGRTENMEWTHLLAWLARDQESALQSIESWRSSAGGPQDRGPDKFERHVLIRLVSDLLTKEEWNEMDKEARCQDRRKKLKELEPSLEAVAREACEPLRRLLGNQSGVLPGDLILAPAQAAVAARQVQLGELLAKIKDHPAKQAKQNHEQALRELERTQADIERSKRTLNKRQKELRELAGSTVNATTVLRSRRSPESCIKTKDDCEFFVGTPETIGALAVIQELEAQEKKAQDSFAAEQSEDAELQAKLPLLQSNEKALREHADGLALEREDLIKQAGILSEQIESQKSVLEPAIARESAYNANKAETKSLSEDISESRARQAVIRKGRFDDRLDLMEYYREVLSFIMGPHVSGSISFDKDGQLVLEAENRSVMSSAAIEALKSLSFDLGVVFRSVTGGGHHPRFLIHDSPKVADMSPVPYAAIFDLVAKVEAKASGNPNFQYIVTTTEPPPEDFRNSEALILTLDASTKAGRLFTKDL